jgi:octaprenyl-diphosphate synthase
LDIKLSDITSSIENDLIEFRAFFKKTIKSDVPLLDILTRYLIKQKGKEVRPILVFLSAQLFGSINQRSMVAATMIELLHTATLLHDDVVDKAHSRRGFVSIHNIWNNKAAILLGDFLLSKGLLIALENNEHTLLEVQSRAVQKMSEGELRQLKTAGLFNMTEERYYQIIEEKTASLIATCCECGAVSTTDDPEIHTKMYAVGKHIGMAFQIKDDLLDYSENEIGKPKRNDIVERKVTLPFIKALQHANKSDARLYKKLMKKRRKSSSEVQQIVDFVSVNNGISHAEEIMLEYATKAKNELRDLASPASTGPLLQLIDFITHRSK